MYENRHNSFLYVYVCVCVYIYIYIYIYMEVDKEINPTVWRKVEKINNLKFNEFIMKVNIECVSCNNLLQDFKFMKNVKSDGCSMK